MQRASTFLGIVIVAVLVGWPFASPAVGAADAAQGIVEHLVGMAGIPRGVCAVLGDEDGTLALALARDGDFFVHVQEPRAAVVAKVRDVLDVDGLYGTRVVADEGPLDALPYGDNVIDIVIAANVTSDSLGSVSAAEIVRALRPGGVAFVGCRADRVSTSGLRAAALEAWMHTADVRGRVVEEPACGLWATFTKPEPAGVDDWSHWEHGPDNNPVSTDTVIKAPYMTQWLGEPYYIAMPAITTAAGGRTFLAMGHIAHHEREEPWLNTLIARNGYNGTELWRRKLPDGYLVHRSAFIATDDAFHMIDLDGNGCLILDPVTGDELRRIEPREIKGEWKWMAMKDGMLYGLAGQQKDPPETTLVRSEYTHWSWGELSQGYYTPRVPWGFGTTLFAIDMASGQVAWTHTEDQPVDSRAMALGGGRVYFYGPDSHIGCLDAKTGAVAWLNDDPETRRLIEEPGRGLGSTPGFRTACFCLYTPKALFFEAQTRMNVVGVSLEDGRRLWHRTKVTNNPNMLFLDGQLVVGLGEDGETLLIKPETGKTIRSFGFKKRSCARLTATPDSMFCRGWSEGLTRYDRCADRVLYNGAVRPSCNDGVVPANGLLYMGPWLCDCNLSLMGSVAMCSDNGFHFDVEATNEKNLTQVADDPDQVASFEVTGADWPMYRGHMERDGCTRATTTASMTIIWHYMAQPYYKATAPTTAGGLLFVGGDDGKVRAVDNVTGELRWVFRTSGPILHPPTIWNGRAYVGSGDGYVYALEAATGRCLWKFRAAPVERRIMVYGALRSTWPVNTGVVVHDGVAYAAAGIIDYDGTYVYALDAVTGKLIWQNNSSGHLDAATRKGVSAQGFLTIANGKLLMAGGNVVSPAAYDLKTGAYCGAGPGDGSPKANRGEEIGVFRGRFVLVGGRLQYSARENVVNPGQFVAAPIGDQEQTDAGTLVNEGKIPPVWNSERIVYVNGRKTAPVCYDADAAAAYLARGKLDAPLPVAWTAQLPDEADVVALAMSNDLVFLVMQTPARHSLRDKWNVAAVDAHSGAMVWQRALPGPALANALAIDRDGRVLVVMEPGHILAFGSDEAMMRYGDACIALYEQGNITEEEMCNRLVACIERVEDRAVRTHLREALEKTGNTVVSIAERQGFLMNWKLLGPFPFDRADHPIDEVFIDEPNVDFDKTYTANGKTLQWREYRLHRANGVVQPMDLFGAVDNVAIYAYAEFDLNEAGDILLKIGSDDGYRLWFNGVLAATNDIRRGYRGDQDVIRVRGVKGANALLMKQTNLVGGWQFSVRVTK